MSDWKRIKYDYMSKGYDGEIPEIAQRVLTCSVDGRIRIDMLIEHMEEMYFINHQWNRNEIIAWMPLPEPCKIE